MIVAVDFTREAVRAVQCTMRVREKQVARYGTLRFCSGHRNYMKADARFLP